MLPIEDDILTNLFTFLITISGAIIGGLIAGKYSLMATRRAHENQKKIADENEAAIIKSLLQAIYDELETVYDRYQETMGSRIESLDKGMPLNFYYPVISDFFTVYHGNSFLIGRIKDHDLRKGIIKTYTLAKGLMDSYRLNNDIVQKYEHWYFVSAETQLEIHKTQAAAYYQSLVSYAEVLKKLHDDLKIDLKSTTRMLNKAGVLS